MAYNISEVKQTERHDVVDIMLKNFGKANAPELAPAMKETAAPWLVARAELDEIRDSKVLNDRGKREARGPVFEKAAKAVATTAKGRKVIEDELKRTRAEAVLIPETERTAELVADEDFARTQLAKMEPLLVNARYKEACGSRRNWVLINAVHRAAKAGFPLVTDQTLAEGQESLLADSPLLPKIEHLKISLGPLRGIDGSVKRKLEDSATEAGFNWRKLLGEASR